jgi:hypothetical protein
VDTVCANEDVAFLDGAIIEGDVSAVALLADSNDTTAEAKTLAIQWRNEGVDQVSAVRMQIRGAEVLIDRRHQRIAEERFAGPPVTVSQVPRLESYATQAFGDAKVTQDVHPIRAQLYAGANRLEPRRLLEKNAFPSQPLQSQREGCSAYAAARNQDSHVLDPSSAPGRSL